MSSTWVGPEDARGMLDIACIISRAKPVQLRITLVESLFFEMAESPHPKASSLTQAALLHSEHGQQAISTTAQHELTLTLTFMSLTDGKKHAYLCTAHQFGMCFQHVVCRVVLQDALAGLILSIKMTPCSSDTLNLGRYC